MNEQENVKIISMDTIQAEEVKWLWYPYIPYGKITIIWGDPGEGKTTFVLKLAALLSRGKCFGEEEEISIQEPVSIIYQTAEDGLADTIKPRLAEAQADCTKILVIDDSEKSLSMQDERIEQAIRKTQAKVLVLDPLQAYLGDKVDMNRANEAREVTKHLASVAERTSCAVILIGHLNKGGGMKAAYRGIGSVDFYAIARSVLLVGKVPDDEEVRAVCQIKNNLALERKTMAFSLGKTGFRWIGRYDISGDELLKGFYNNNDNKKETAENFLKSLLGQHDSYPANEIFIQGKKLGISKRTIENVKQELGIKSVRVGTGWHWSMK